MSTRCDLCEYWEESESFGDGSAIGWCHRYPATILMEDPESTYRHIEIWNNDWCGEFKDVSDPQADSILRLELSVRARRCLLEHAKVTSISEVEKMKDSELLRIKNLGETCLREIRRKITFYYEIRKRLI